MRIHSVLLALLVPSLSLAVELPPDLRPSPSPKMTQPSGDGMRDAREGGESWDDAVVIAALPYSDTGATCDNTDDITLPCAAGVAPDIVYRYTAPENQTVDVSLCASGYDTVLGIYDEDHNIRACNDDHCELQSEINDFLFEAGRTYFIVVDGYRSSCGSYTVSVAQTPPPCVLECPPDAEPEGEPPCVDGYYDVYNSGCGGVRWTPVHPRETGCATMCGRSCTFLYNGASYRDTDWYEAATPGGTVTVTCTAEFPVQLILIYNAICHNLQYVLAQGEACEPVTVSWNFAPDQLVWIWVGPSNFSGVPESDYVLEVCGLRELGACCFPTYCTLAAPAWCEEYGGRWLGYGTDCDPAPCGTDPPGACCLVGGECEIRNESSCAAEEGTFMGAGTDCDPDPCQAIPTMPASWGSIKAFYR